ncbi:MAG: GumC family protein [Alphaproteobacteria bacterium]
MTTITRLPVPSGEDPGPESGFGLAAPADTALDLRRILSILKRRKVMILGVMFVVTSLAALVVSQLTPLYRAEVTLVVESSRQNIAPIQAVVQGLNPDLMTNETEAAILTSRELAAKAVERLNLVNNPLYNPDLLPKKGLLSAIFDPITEAVMGGAGLSPEAAGIAPEEKRRTLVQATIDKYLRALSVTASERSRVLTLQFVSPDARLAALGANTTSELYILDQLAAKGETTSRASDWLKQHAEELHERVIESEQKLEDYRRQSGIVDTGGASVYQSQLGRLNEELVLARTKLAESDARARQVQELVKSGNLDTAAAVLDSKIIQSLTDQEAQVSRKLAELKTQLKDTHPQVKLTEHELADIKGKISSEVQKIAANLSNELTISRARAGDLAGQVANMERKVGQQNESEVTLRSLESEVKANKTLYETLLGRLKETDVQQDASMQQPDARIISRATVPSIPYYPRRGLLIMAALVVSAALGMALALVVEHLDSGFRSLSQVESLTGMPTLALVPKLKDVAGENARPHQIAVERPNSSYGEAIRTIRTGLLLSHLDHPPRTVMVCSSVPGEGKSSVALSLACSAARSTQKAIVIDCDLRHSSLHNYLGCPNKIGLTDYLAGQASLEDVVEIDPHSGVHFITAGSRAPNPVDLLGSQEMKKLLTRLSSLYDLVVIDSPPLLPVSDAMVLARVVDKTIFLIRWEKTKREAALLGLKLLIEAGANVAGIALTQVDVRKHATYDYSDSGYYYSSSYKNYYIE